MAEWTFIVVSILLALILLVVLELVRRRGARPHRIEAETTWRIVVPREARFSVTQAAAWFGALPSLLGAASVSVELAARGQSLELMLTAPSFLEASLRSQLAAWFPESRLERVSEDAKAHPTVFQALRLKKPELFPLPTAEDGEADPLLGVIGALTHGATESGIRLTLRREPADWKPWSRRGLALSKAGLSVPPRHWPTWVHFPYELAAHIIQGQRTSGAGPAAVELAAAKCRGPVLDARLTVWASGELEEATRQVTRVTAQLVAAFRDPLGNALVTDGAPTRWQPDSATRVPRKQWCVLSPLELASLFHLPSSAHPLVPTEPGRRVPPVREFLNPAEARQHTTWLGEALTGEGTAPVGLGPDERRLHLYVVGKTGTGKSTFLAHLARQDLERGHGLALIDPHGDLAERVLSLVPSSRHEDVLYFNAADTEYPIGFNLFHTRTTTERPLVASGVVGVFKKLYGDSWGPRLEHFLRNAVLTLLEAPSPSLLLLPRLLTDKPYRQRLLTHVRDPLLRTFFLEEYERYDPRWRAEAISPILNKIGQFLAAPAVRHIVGQSGPGFNLRELMDRRGIFIANLASGKIGEDNCDLLGGLLVAGFQLAAMSRANQPEAERQDFYLLVDEFQHFANSAFITILSEARKYRLALTLSHQYLDQVPAEISEAVFGNVGSLAAFRIGAGDVGRVGKEFAPAFDGQDLVHLPNHHFCARLARRHGTAPAFSARTLVPAADTAIPDQILQGSRDRWSRPRAEVELEILDAWEGRLPL